MYKIIQLSVDYQRTITRICIYFTDITSAQKIFFMDNLHSQFTSHIRKWTQFFTLWIIVKTTLKWEKVFPMLIDLYSPDLVLNEFDYYKIGSFSSKDNGL